jgi:hypothetical protein
MYRLVFALIWTAGTLVLALVATGGMTTWERALIYLFPAFGLMFTALSWLHWRRGQSLRTEVENGVTIYVWIDFRGRECRSTEDPRPDWDDADGDGDGDGGGD